MTKRYNLENIRVLLIKGFAVEELRRFCKEESFRSIYERLGPDTDKETIVDLILEYAEQRLLFDELLERLQEMNPRRYEAHQPYYFGPDGFLAFEEFSLKFANREVEKELIQKLLDSDFYVQIHAPGGLGKTYMLREIQREMSEQGWLPVWIDFASNEYRPCLADRYRLLHEFACQALGDAAPSVTEYEEDKAFELVGRGLADLDKIIFLLDNADRGDSRLLTWVRETFLERLSTKVTLRMVASGQKIIDEWQGYRPGRPFRELSLSSFEDPRVIRDILDDIVARFGARRAKEKWEAKDEKWQADLEIMVEGLYRIARGHPLVIERVLDYAVKTNGLVDATFFADKWDDICDRCLVPIVGGRILPTMDNAVREAFRSVCVFRFVWPTLIRSLVESEVPSELGGPWEPFSDDGKDWEEWWSRLQEAHLIYDVGERQMFPLSPVVRQVIALVLKHEDGDLYRARNGRARQEYEKLISSKHIPASQRAAYVFEVFYHATQDGSLSHEDALTAFTQTLTDFLNGLSDDEVVETTRQLLKWIYEDAELREAANQFAGPQLYDQLMKTIAYTAAVYSMV